MSEWPDDTPVVEHIRMAATLRNDEPVAQVDLIDISGDHRTAQFTVTSAIETIAELARFLRQVGVNTESHSARNRRLLRDDDYGRDPNG